MKCARWKKFEVITVTVPAQGRLAASFFLNHGQPHEGAAAIAVNGTTLIEPLRTVSDVALVLLERHTVGPNLIEQDARQRRQGI